LQEALFLRIPAEFLNALQALLEWFPQELASQVFHHFQVIALLLQEDLHFIKALAGYMGFSLGILEHLDLVL